MSEPRRPRRRRRALLVAVISSVVVLATAEGVMRGLLFSDIAWLADAGRKLRKAGKWADQDSESLYWKLRYYWAPKGRRRSRANFPDPLLGWLRRDVAPGSYAHRAAPLAGGRRPVLLYGDSFAQGVGASEDLYESLFASSDAADEFVLVNYGVGGYGVGQIYLLLRESLEQYAEREPIVVLGVLMDDDLNRTVLDFRGWPKPLVHLRGEQLVVDPPPLLDSDEYLAKYPPSTPSWLWRYLSRSPLFLTESWRARLRGDAEALERMKEVNRAVFAEARDLLNSHGVEWFVMVFVSQGSMNAPRLRGWKEGFLLKTFEELEIPFVITRPDLQAWAEREGIDRAELFIQGGRWKGHHTRAGNEATLGTILRGMRGEFDPYEFVSTRR